MSFGKCINLCSHHFYHFIKHIHKSKKFHYVSVESILLPLAQATTNLCSAFTDLFSPFQHLIYTETYYMSSFTFVFVHTITTLWMNNVLIFIADSDFIILIYHNVLIHLLVDGHLCPFQFGVKINKIAMNIYVKVLEYM